MRTHCDNALAVAEWLAAHPKVAWVSYPGLSSDRYYALAKKYCPAGAGAVFTFGLRGGYEAGVKLVSNVQLFSHLANIGDTRSLIIHPASTTHRQLTDEQKVAACRPRRGAAFGRHRGQGRHHRRPRTSAVGLKHRFKAPVPLIAAKAGARFFASDPGFPLARE
jgi:hypothetical protein